MSDNSKYTGTSTVLQAGISVVNNALPPGYVLRNPQNNYSYQIGEVLGQGGFGITYSGRCLNDGRLVAVKEYYPSRSVTRTQKHSVSVNTGNNDFKSGLSSFLKEAQVLYSLRNLSCVVMIYDYFYANNTAYYVMEYVNGVTMENYLKSSGLMNPAQWLPQYRLLMRDLAQVHARDVIHRDITPDNIIILRDGRFKLIDFGSARKFAGAANLTVHLKKAFAPIEQYSPTGQGAYTDVYSLAATMYYSFCGKAIPQSVKRAEKDEYVPLSRQGIKLSHRQEQAMAKALAVKPEKRFRNMQEFEAAFFGDEAAVPAGSGGNSSTGEFTAKFLASFEQLKREPLLPLASGIMVLAAMLVQLI